MQSIELQLFDIFKRGGLHEPEAKEAATLIENTMSHESLAKTFIRKDTNVSTKADIVELRQELRVGMATMQSQMKTLQMLFAAVGIPILIAIFMQLFR